MPPSHKYKLAKPAKSGRGLDRLLAIAALAAVIGLLWYFSRPAKPRHKAGSIATTPTTKPAPVNPPVQVEVSKTRIVIPAPAVTNTPAPEKIIPPPPDTARKPHDVFETQVALMRLGISAGSIDGALGSQTRAALRAFQRQEKIPPTGNLDGETRNRLLLEAPALTSYVITSNDLARLQPVSKTWLGKSQQSALEYETALELVSEKFHAHPKQIRLLNPAVDWTNVFFGTGVTVPDAAYPKPATKASWIVISLAEKTLEAFDEQTNLLAHFPCSIAAKVEKRPAGELHVVALAPNPNYTFNPEIFPEVPEARSLTNKLILQPGPNNPVGTVWISLDKPGYGMHGTPKPEDVGRTESHGCFRLANWNAEFLLKLAWVGLPVRVEP